ncbi:MAG: amidohydrolase family protein [Rhodospirillales bacterium]|nr:amidohydrolase family protein [Rhodospirillales bacterium]
MKKIDIFNHIQPERYFEEISKLDGAKGGIGQRTASVSRLRDLDGRFREMDEFGDYRQVVTIPGPQPGNLAGPEKAAEIARIGNDSMAELVDRYPDRFAGFAASLALNNPDGAVEEARRAVTQLGAKGIEVFTNVGGKPIDGEEFEPLWATMVELDLPIWLHPSRSANQSEYSSEKKSHYEIWFTFGYPYETGAAMARIVFSGIMDRYPSLKFITHHLGGVVPYFDGRVGPGWETMGTRTTDEDYSGLLAGLKRPHEEYFKSFYGDTAMFGGRAGTVCGLDYFGADNVLFATDMPFDPEAGQFIRETIAVIDSLDISDDDRAKIYYKNAEAYLKL